MRCNKELPSLRVRYALDQFSEINWAQMVFLSVFVCALGDFLALFAPVLRQIARYLPHHRSGNASKTHPKSSHDKFKTASKKLINKSTG